METNIYVNTGSGHVHGFDLDGIKIFKGIPYAEPPVGENRFRGPRPVKPWKGVFDALCYGPVAVQTPSPPEFSKLNLPVDEAACLTLNIWTPGLDGEKRPVMFWIHGGSLAIGSGAEYDGQKLAARGNVVVVTINYRLGIFGFLYVPGKTANAGLMDQIEALQWVKNNVAQFGGDPENITLFGESAGALSISVLITMPRAKGLFKRVILESNACTSFHHKASGGESVGRKVFEALEISYGDIDSLREVPADTLLEVYQKIQTFTPQIDFYPPFIDGDTIPVHPLEALSGGVAADVDVLAGYNSNEATLFSLWNPNIDKMSEPDVRSLVAGVLKKIAKPGFDDKQCKTLVDFYLKQPPTPTNREVWERFLTDNMFRIPVTRYLEIQSRFQSHVYLYEFAWKTPQMDGKLGATHALELHFVFDRFENTPFGIYPARNPEVEAISRAMMDAWTSFARSGNPGHKLSSGWPEFSEKDRIRMVFDKKIAAVDGALDKRDLIWRKIV